MPHHSLACLLVIPIVLATACGRQAPAPGPLPPSAEPAATAANFDQTLPEIGGPEGYTGSQTCRDCHQDQFASWHRSYHRTMTQIAATNSVLADFNNVVLTNENARFTLTERNGEYWVSMQPPHDPAAQPLEVRMGLITGSHHMQVFWVPEGHGNMQIGFPFTWLIPEQRWVPRNSTFIRPPDMTHNPEIWNVVCSRCHTTGVEPRTDIASRTIETRAAELGISCEACHGPGQRHVEAQRTAAQAGGPKRVAPGEIVHPEKLDPVRASQICGFCHSMKWIPESENWRVDGFEFRPGDDLEKTTPVIRPNQIPQIDELVAYLRRNPDILDDFFWPDGMIRVSGREYNGLIESPCYQGGEFSCLSCHSLHDSEPDDQLASFAKRDGGNQACLQCHQNYQEPAALTAHTRHGAGSSGSECFNCHMPHTTYGVLKAIRSHEISSPRVADELATGRPNACNLCHLDRTLDWTATHLQQWFKQEVPGFETMATNAVRSVHLALAGDAAQRALIAWHLSWPPALGASGTNWLAPLLGQLLDDPYAAVRCVAERSLRAISNLAPADYDFTVQPNGRPAVRGQIWNNWQAQSPALDPERARLLLVSPNDLERQREAFDSRAAWRDHRPVRLRE